jgi:hypothetical protein
MTEPVTMRTHAEVSRFFDGLDLVDPVWSSCTAGGQDPKARSPITTSPATAGWPARGSRRLRCHPDASAGRRTCEGWPARGRRPWLAGGRLPRGTGHLKREDQG